MMPEVSIYYLMAIFRVFLLIIGQRQSFSVIAFTKNGIDMKCLDSLKPLCEVHAVIQILLSVGTLKSFKIYGRLAHVDSNS